MDHLHQLQKKMDELKEMFKSQMTAFESSVSTRSPDMPSLESEYQSFKILIWKAVDSLQQQMGFVLASLEELETRSRAGILLLHGVKEAENEHLIDKVTAAFKQQLQVQSITSQSFVSCHRLGRVRDAKSRPILVKFGCPRIRDVVWSAKKKFKGSGYTLSEFLTASRHEVFVEARRIFGIRGSWTSDGRVVVQCRDGTRRKVTTLAELRSLPAPTIADVAAGPPASVAAVAPVSSAVVPPASAAKTPAIIPPANSAVAPGASKAVVASAKGGSAPAQAGSTGPALRARGGKKSPVPAGSR